MMYQRCCGSHLRPERDGYNFDFSGLHYKLSANDYQQQQFIMMLLHFGIT